MSTVDHSRPVKYHVGTIMKWKPRKGFAVVDHNSGTDSCWIKYYGEKPIAVSEHDSRLRKINLLEFFCFRSPVTDRLQLGGNGFVGSVIGILAGVGMLFSDQYIEDQPFWRWLVFGIGASIISAIVIGTIRNYFGKRL